MRHPSRLAPLLVLLAVAGCRPDAPADLVIFAPVWTGDSARPHAAGVAVRDGRVVAVGDSAALAGLVGSGTERIDRPDGLVVPGFIDDHVHLFAGGFQLASVDLRDAATPAEFTRRIAAFARTLPPGEWIQGGDWDHELMPGAVLPDRRWIDSVTPNNPVFVNRLDGHMALANTAALRAAGLDRSTGPIPGGEIVRRPDGDLTGVLKDGAMDPVAAVIPEPVARPSRFGPGPGAPACRRTWGDRRRQRQHLVAGDRHPAPGPRPRRADPPGVELCPARRLARGRRLAPGGWAR